MLYCGAGLLPAPGSSCGRDACATIMIHYGSSYAALSALPWFAGFVFLGFTPQAGNIALSALRQWTPGGAGWQMQNSSSSHPAAGVAHIASYVGYPAVHPAYPCYPFFVLLLGSTLGHVNYAVERAVGALTRGTSFFPLATCYSLSSGHYFFTCRGATFLLYIGERGGLGFGVWGLGLWTGRKEKSFCFLILFILTIPVNNS